MPKSSEVRFSILFFFILSFLFSGIALSILAPVNSRLRDELDSVKGQMRHYKKFFEKGEVILEPDVLEEIGILLKSSPDQIIITHERMHAVGARAKGVNELVKKGSEVYT